MHPLKKHYLSLRVQAAEMAAAADSMNVDLCITLGGDGTFLHMASLFSSDEPCPPSVSFSMGTLGFLTPFDVSDYQVSPWPTPCVC